MAEQLGLERRRRRPAVVCTLCRKRKLRCNRESPCSNCLRSKSANCVYENPPPPPRSSHLPLHFSEPDQATRESFDTGVQQIIPSARLSDTGTSAALTASSRPSGSLVAISTRPSSPAATQLSARDVELLRARIQQLEDQLSKLSRNPINHLSATPNSTIEIASSQFGSLAGTFHIHRHGQSNGQTRAASHGILYKSRLWGRSNWINDIAVYLDIIGIDQGLFEDSSKTAASLRRCKYLARVIKTQRALAWPCPPTAELPPKNVADDLVDCYVRTVESFYRILHVPTFRRDYEALWESNAKPDPAFLVQVKLVFALGAVAYDDLFSLRTFAVRWVYEAQTWVSAPQLKSRTIDLLQTKILLLIARESVNIGGDTSWVSAGALLRSAMLLGLHTDPSYLTKRTPFMAEMRRRIWNTILELAVQASLFSGSLPLISLADFNTAPPGNFDDQQISNENPVPKPESDFSETSIAIAFRKTLSVRLEVLRFLNSMDSRRTYKEALRLDAEVRNSYRSLRGTITEYRSARQASAFRFGMRVADILMLRNLSALHGPYSDPTLDENTYAFSRKTATQTASNIWRAAYCGSTIGVPQLHGDQDTSDQVDFTRFLAGGHGHFRAIALHPPLILALDLRSQLREDCLDLVPVHPDVLTAIEEAKAWCLKCIEAGETNVKAHLLVHIVAAQIRGVLQGAKESDLSTIITKAAEDANESALSVLERMAATGKSEGTGDEHHQIPSNSPSDAMEEWDFMTTENLFGQGNSESMKWIFNDDMALGISLGALTLDRSLLYE